MHLALLLAAWWTLPGEPVHSEARDGAYRYAVTNDGPARRAIAVLDGFAARLDLNPAPSFSLAGWQKPQGQVSPVDSVDFAGARQGSLAILFWLDRDPARGAASFTIDGAGPLKILIAGLAPGTWEFWRNGWLEETGLRVERGSTVLRFDGEPGSYFIRRLN